MQREDVLTIVHDTAAEFAASNGRAAAEAHVDPGGDNLLVRYGFTSLDALEYLLILEEKLGVRFEDEDLTENVLSSAVALAGYIVERQGAAEPAP